MVSYNPLKSFSAPFIGTVGEPSIPLSQLPRTYLYPSASQGSSMLLPFVYHRQWLDITSSTDVRNMGSIIFTVLDSLKTASTSNSNITIQVYAWMEDIQLSGPTCSLSLQSGSKDEYGKGLVSTTASAIASATNSLKNAPLIGPYATATSIISSATATVAKAFGYTNVPVIDDVHSLKPTPFPHLSSTDIGTSIEKLTLDSKNELTIDPQVCGADFGDELQISNIVCRESYYTKFTWSTARSSNDLLFNIRVTPANLATTSGVGQTILNGTPTWLVAKMFNNWTGDMEYRFKIICSQYHRGRLRFSWDPNGPISTTSETTTEVYTKIVDIAESTDIVIRIPYMQDTAYLFCGDANVQPFSTLAVTKAPFYENGVLTVRVLTELSAPTSSADVTVLCFSRGTDNLEFANPKVIDNTNTISPFTVQSGLLAYDNEDEDISSIAMQPSVTPPQNNLIYMGESIKSLRTLLRRAQYIRTAMRNSSIPTTDNKGVMRIWFNRFPPSPGYDPNGIHDANPITGVLPQRYNFVPWNYITWLGQCFLGCRGSIMWYSNTQTSLALSETILARSHRPPNTAGIFYLRDDYTPTLFSNATQFSFNRTLTTQYNGMSQGYNLTNQKTCASNSALLPFYSLFKFRQCFPGTAVLGTFVAESRGDFVQYNAILNPKYDGTNNAQNGTDFSVSFFASAGTDFSFIFFLAVPTLFQYSSYPTSIG